MRLQPEAFEKLDEFIETVGDLLNAIEAQCKDAPNPFEAECARVVAAGEAWANAIIKQKETCDCPGCRARRASEAFSGKVKLN